MLDLLLVIFNLALSYSNYLSWTKSGDAFGLWISGFCSAAAASILIHSFVL